MGFSREEHWSGFPCPPLQELPNPGIEPLSLMSPALANRFFTMSTTWEASCQVYFKNLGIVHKSHRGLKGGRRRQTLGPDMLVLTGFFLFASYILLGAGGARISELPTRGNLRSPKNCLLFPTRKAWKVNLARQKGCPTPDKTRPPSCASQPRPGEQPWFPPLHIYHELLPIQVVSEGSEQEASFHSWMVKRKKKKETPSPHNVGRNHMGILDFHPHLPWDGVRGYSEEIWSFHYNSVRPPLCQWRITGEQ